MVFEALFIKDGSLVHLTGIDGIGKRSTAKAVAHCIVEKRMVGDVYWLPRLERGGDDEKITIWFELVKLFECKNTIEIFSLDKDYHTIFEAIAKEMKRNGKALLVLDTLNLSERGTQNARVFVCDIISRMNQNVKVIVIRRPSTRFKPSPSAPYYTEQEIILKPLERAETIKLFTTYCPHSDERDLNLSFVTDERWGTETVWNVLGNGIPWKTIFNAKNISREEYLNLANADAASNDDAFRAILALLAASEEEMAVDGESDYWTFWFRTGAVAVILVSIVAVLQLKPRK